MRSDGVLYGYARLDNTDNAVGRRVLISTETGMASDAGNDNIPDRNPTPNYQLANPNNSPWFRDVATTDNVDALTYKRLGRPGNLGTAANYDLYYVVRESDTGTNSKLYRANADTGSAARAAKSGANNYYGERGDIQPTGVTFATANVAFIDNATPPAVSGTVIVQSKVPGTAGNFTLNIQRADANNAIFGASANSLTVMLDTNPLATPQDLINLINNDATARQFFVADLISGALGGNSTNGPNGPYSGTGNDGSTNAFNGLIGDPLRGRVTGIAYDQFTNGTLFGVTTEGELVVINDGSGSVTEAARLQDARRWSRTVGLPGAGARSAEHRRQQRRDRRLRAHALRDHLQWHALCDRCPVGCRGGRQQRHSCHEHLEARLFRGSDPLAIDHQQRRRAGLLAAGLQSLASHNQAGG